MLTRIPVTRPTVVDKPISADDVGKIDLDKLLLEAVEMGCHFNRAQAATIRETKPSSHLSNEEAASISSGATCRPVSTSAPLRDNNASSSPSSRRNEEPGSIPSGATNRPTSRINQEPASTLRGATSRPASTSARTEPIRDINASSRPSSRRNEGEASELETLATNAGPATTEGGECVDETLVVIAIGLHRAGGVVEEVTTSMKMDANPMIDKVLERMKREDDPSTQNLRQMLELIPPQRVQVATAKKPVRVRQVADLKGKWGDGFKVLGKLEDIDQSKWHLQPCDPCPEMVEIRTAANPPLSSSSPMYVMYLIELEVSTA